MAENPKAFKHLIGGPLLDRMADEIDRVRPGLATDRIRGLLPQLERLELKDRVVLIRTTLHEILPGRYALALPTLVKVARSSSLNGFDLWPITDFVQTYGTEEFDRSMKALHFLTRRFTAEFAIRPFLAAHHERTFAVLGRWAEDPNHHVRRCASEGSRPRLPWGQRVQRLIDDPRPGLDVLEKLRFDPEEYVRRSVANHLNDVTKDHPDVAIATLTRWRRECPREHRDRLEWIVSHALRGLIKSGHAGALAMIGAASDAQVLARDLELRRERVRVGESLDFSCTLLSTGDAPQRVVVDYVVHYVKANGGLARKVYKLRTFDLAPGAEVTLGKAHSLKPITTRTYYPGLHRLGIQVNGRVLIERTWRLDRPNTRHVSARARSLD